MTQTKAELLQTKNQGDIRLGDADSSHYVGFKAPATVAANKVWTLPAADGSANQVLKTNGSGILSWAADSAITEGTAVLSTGESSTSKFLRTDGDGTCSWQTVTGTTINNNADNRLITGSGTANTLEGESTLTYDGSSLYVSSNKVLHAGNVGSGQALSGVNVYANQFYGAGSNLTNLNASNFTSGTMNPARLGSGHASYKFLRGDNTWNYLGAGDLQSGGTFPAISGVNLTSLNATNLGSGTVPTARLGSGTASSSTFLRGDGSWNAVSISSSAQENTLVGTDTGSSFSGTDAYYNSLFGYRAGGGITTGDGNTLMGRYAGYNTTTGGYNTSFGTNAGRTITTGSNNTCVGWRAGFTTLTTGSNNMLLGHMATASSASVSNEVTIGDTNITKFRVPGLNFSLKDTTATNNYILTVDSNGDCGWEAPAGAVLNSDNSQNTRAGTDAGYNGSYNSFYGHDAGKDNSSGSRNTFIGDSSGLKCTTGTNNTALGQYSGGSVTNTMTGDRNTSIGYQAGNKIKDGDDNVAVGYLALYDLTDGHDNTCVGQRAGMLITTGENNLLLGNHSGRSNSPAGNLYTSNNILCLGNNDISDFYCADTSISSSDSRDKTDITNFTHGLSWINKLNPITYRWDKRTWYTEYNDDGSVKSTATPDGTKKRARQHIGFLAQDVLAVEQADGFASKKDDMLLVNLNEDDTAYGLKYERLVPVLVNAIKELSTEVNTLKTKVAALEAA